MFLYVLTYNGDVPREVRFFDQKIIQKELDALPDLDKARLLRAIRAYADDLSIGFEVKNYKDHGLLMITDSGRGQGRGLFATVSDEAILILKVYKKESLKADQSALNAAMSRKKKQ